MFIEVSYASSKLEDNIFREFEKVFEYLDVEIKE